MSTVSVLDTATVIPLESVQAASDVRDFLDGLAVGIAIAALFGC
jgi:hypothetical protein